MDSLLAAAARLGLRVVGVSFHVGSGATNPDAFTEVRMYVYSRTRISDSHFPLDEAYLAMPPSLYKCWL